VPNIGNFLQYPLFHHVRNFLLKKNNFQKIMFVFFELFLANTNPSLWYLQTRKKITRLNTSLFKSNISTQVEMFELGTWLISFFYGQVSCNHQDNKECHLLSQAVPYIPARRVRDAGRRKWTFSVEFVCTSLEYDQVLYALRRGTLKSRHAQWFSIPSTV
jgi:hypothetical protein